MKIFILLVIWPFVADLLKDFVKADIADWISVLTRKIVRWKSVESQRDECLAELASREGPLSKLRYALGFFWTVGIGVDEPEAPTLPVAESAIDDSSNVVMGVPAGSVSVTGLPPTLAINPPPAVLNVNVSEMIRIHDGRFPGRNHPAWMSTCSGPETPLALRISISSSS